MRRLSGMISAIVSVTCAFSLAGCPFAGPGDDETNGSDGTNTTNGTDAGGAATDQSSSGDGDAGVDEGASDGELSGTWDAAAGLQLIGDGVSLMVAADATPTNAIITARRLSASELQDGGPPAGTGFDQGIAFGPSGTTFAKPVQVRLKLAMTTNLSSLPVLLLDEATGVWGDAGVTATVEEGGQAAIFEITHFSSYGVWNPPLPQGTVLIEPGEIIAGSGLFHGQPFTLTSSNDTATASLTYSPFGDVFALSVVQFDLTNPTTGDLPGLSAGLHSSIVQDIGGVIVGLVTPGGGLSGPSLFNDGRQNNPVSGIMYLRKQEGQWVVDAYCAYLGGIVFGQARGDL